MFFYGLDGKKLGTYTPSVVYGGQGGVVPQSIAFGGTTNTYFAGRMVLQNGVAFIQDRLGSNGKYFPYGEERNYPALPNDQVKFATYTRDSATGLDYADQRYYSSSLARFLTPDPYRRSGRLAVPLSLNRYNYVGGDPINRNDPSGLCDVTIAGITQSSANAPDIASYGSSDITVFPYAGGASQGFVGYLQGVAQAAAQAFGPTSNTYGVVIGLLNAAEQGGPINVTTFSGGAAAFTAAVNWLNSNGEASVTSMIGNITYVSPGAFGSLYTNSSTIALLGNDSYDGSATLTTSMEGFPIMQASDCGHNFGCIATHFAQLLLSRQGTACSNPQVINVTGPHAASFGSFFGPSYDDWTYYTSGDVYDASVSGVWYDDPAEPLPVVWSTIQP